MASSPSSETNSPVGVAAHCTSSSPSARPIRRNSDSTSSTGRPLASPAVPSASRQRRIDVDIAGSVTEDRLEAAEQTGDDERARRTVKMVFATVFLAAASPSAASWSPVGALMAAACFLGAVA